MPNKLCKPIKDALVKQYGYKNVSVKNGTGTAWGWVEIELITDRPVNCTCDGIERCKACRENLTEKEAYKTIYNALNVAGLRPYTYTADDGYNTERDDILLQVKYRSI